MNVALVVAALSAATASVQYLLAHDVRGALRAELTRVADAQQMVLEIRRADADRRAAEPEIR